MKTPLRATAALALLIMVLFPVTRGTQRAAAYPFGMREYPGNPVYDPADHRAYYPCVLYDAARFSGRGPSSYYKMWYGGHLDAPGATCNMALVCSDDGIHWSEPVELSGILSTGYHAQVVYIPEGFGSGPYYYKIWYWVGFDMRYTIRDIRTADSTDGINWVNDQELTQDDAAPLVTGTWPDWNRGSYGPVCVLYNPQATNSGANPFDYTFAMYYDGTTGGVEVIGLGYSADGNHWYRYGNDPVLGLGAPGEWDSAYVTFGTVIRDPDGAWHLWYSGGRTAAHEGIGYAFSDDGIHWTKDPANPILHISDGVPWRDARTYTPSVLYSPTRFDGHGEPAFLKMWFSGRTNTPSTNYAVGYLTTPDPLLSLDKEASPEGEVEPGTELTYTVTASNLGTGPATACLLEDVLPDHAAYVPSSTTLNGEPVPDVGGQCPLSGGIPVNSPGEAPGVIAAGEAAVVTFRAVVDGDAPDGVEVVNRARLTSAEEPQVLEAQASNRVRVPPPVLSLEKSAYPPGEITRGQVVTYTLRLRNLGPSAAQGAALSDPPPPYTSYVTHTTTLNGMRVPDAEQGSPLASGMPVNSPGEPAGVIAPGEEAVVTFMVQVGGDLPLGASIHNQATATAENAEPVEAGCVNPSSAQLPATWYFAEGSTQPGFDQFLLLSNMGEEDMEVTVTYLTEDGEERSFPHALPAHSRRTVYVNSEMPGESGLGSIVSGEQGLVCERSMYYRYGSISGGDIVTGATAPSLDLFLAEGFTGIPGSEFDEWILVLNPAESEAEVTVDYLFPGGDSLSKVHRVAPRSRATVSVDAEVGEGQEVSARLRSSIPVVVERAMYFRYWNGWAGGHTGMACTGSRTDWYLAEGYTGQERSRFDTWILVANENDSPTPVTVTYMLPGGTNQVVTHTAPARGRLTISADRDLGEGKEFSARLHSELPVVAERAMYFDYWNMWDGGHNGLALPSPVAERYFAEGYTGNPSSRFQTWLLLQNTAEERKGVRVEYMLGSGEVMRQTLDLDPLSRTTLYVNQVLGGESLEFAIRVSTSDGSPCVLAERSMYFEYTGSFGSSRGGHVASGY